MNSSKTAPKAESTRHWINGEWVGSSAAGKSISHDCHPELTCAAWGFAPETATHALRIVYRGIIDRFPTAKLVLGHLGESLPFLAWRIQHGINFSPNGRFTKKPWSTISRRTYGSPRAAISAPRRFIARS